MNQQRGFSLVEMLIVSTISAVLLAIGAPAWNKTVEQHRIQAAAETFRTDYQMARAQTMATRLSVQVALEETAAGSCYVIFQGPQKACRCGEEGKAVCEPGATVLASQVFPSKLGVRMDANVKLMTLGANFGTVTPAATVKFQGSAGTHLKHIIAMTGRVRSCGTASMGAPACKG